MNIQVPENLVGDVLFVNGCDPRILPHPYRYRVQHQREQLFVCGLSSGEVLYYEVTKNLVRNFRIIIFYRCPYCEQIEEAIREAKALNKTILYDIDDLVVDTVYTDLIPFVRNMNETEKAEYDSGVLRMGRTLQECEAAITTTERLKAELLNYVPEVFINRNRASDEMLDCSEKALLEKKDTVDERVIIGYFSGSITHNADIEMILPVLEEIMDEYPNVQLLTVGELSIPPELERFHERIQHHPFVDWKELPALVAQADINIAPLEDTIFNEAKSENKWVEAALVQVPTIASDLGAFHQVIKDRKTGLLCSDAASWKQVLKLLIEDPEERKRIAENAYAYCKEAYYTLRTGEPLTEYLKSKARPHAAFVLPSLQISGGIMVALSHALILQDAGWDVDIFATEERAEGITFRGHTFHTIDYRMRPVDSFYDLMVATMWTTAGFVESYTRAKRKIYLVQNLESEFYHYGDPQRLFAEATYRLENIEYLTISRWCESFLKEQYGQKDAQFLPNALWDGNYHFRKRDFSGKIRILIEGDCTSEYKNVDESFAITDLLDRERFEVWYLCYSGEPKENYRIDRFFSRVPYEKVGLIYEQCDILVKSSYLESFSYPPLEMMATGGLCVVLQNEGNQEYINNEYNCLTYEKGNIKEGAEAILRICEDEELRNALIENGRKTAESRSMESIRQRILSYYSRS